MSKAASPTSPSVSSGDVEYSDLTRLPSTPIVSVDMITYQHAPFIKEAIESVLMQKVDFPYEICLGEDGSTDGTREICLDYARRYPDRIRLFLRDRSNPDRRSFDAPYMFNAASTFSACRGKFIALLEGDDYWTSPDKLQSQVNQMQADATLGASSHYTTSLEENKPWAARAFPAIPLQSITLKDVLRRDVMLPHTSTWLLRRGKPMEWQAFKTSMFGDYPLIIWALFQGGSGVLPRVWSVYRTHEGGAFSPMANDLRLKANVDLWKCLEQMVPPDLHRDWVAGLCKTLTMHTAALSRAGKYATALAAFRSTMREIPRTRSGPIASLRLRLLAAEALTAPRIRGLLSRVARLRSQG